MSPVFSCLVIGWRVELTANFVDIHYANSKQWVWSQPTSFSFGKITLSQRGPNFQKQRHRQSYGAKCSNDFELWMFFFCTNGSRTLWYCVLYHPYYLNKRRLVGVFHGEYGCAILFSGCGMNELKYPTFSLLKTIYQHADQPSVGDV